MDTGRCVRNEKKQYEISFEILSNGKIRFRRKKENGNIISILRELCDFDEVENLKHFLNSSDKIELILGDDILCG